MPKLPHKRFRRKHNLMFMHIKRRHSVTESILVVRATGGSSVSSASCLLACLPTKRRVVISECSLHLAWISRGWREEEEEEEEADEVKESSCLL